MRGILKSGAPTKSSKKGRAWSEVWAEQMQRCKGFVEGPVEAQQGDDVVEGEEDSEADEIQEREDESAGMLGCSPVTVVYGHAGKSGARVNFGTDA